MRKYIPTYIPTHTYTYLHIRTYIHIYVHTLTCSIIYMYIHSHVATSVVPHRLLWESDAESLHPWAGLRVKRQESVHDKQV